MVLIAYDRQPFTLGTGFEGVWSNYKKGIQRLLDDAQIFNVSRIVKLSEEELTEILKNCETKNHLHLHQASKNFVYSHAIKEIAKVVDTIRRLTLHAQTREDIGTLHRNIVSAKGQGIYGFGKTLATKFIMYTLRELQISDTSIPPAEFGGIAELLEGEIHDKRWIDHLKQTGLYAEVCHHLAPDPFVIDFLWYLDRTYCVRNLCDYLPNYPRN